MKKIIIFIILLTHLIISSFADDEKLIIHYFHRPPYYIKETNNNVSGFLVEITKLILNNAKINYEFKESNPKRILSDFQNEKSNSISIGWFKNPERENFAYFSLPIYQDGSLGIIISNKVAKKLPDTPKLEDIITNNLNLGLIEGFSYGNVIDEKLKNYKGKFVLNNITVEQIIKMIANGRFDCTILSIEEAKYYLNNDTEVKNKAKFLKLSDSPIGNYRYLMINKSVNISTIDKINAAIEKIKKTQEYKNLTKFE